jgi:hypothetical protein
VRSAARQHCDDLYTTRAAASADGATRRVRQAARQCLFRNQALQLRQHLQQHLQSVRVQ